MALINVICPKCGIKLSSPGMEFSCSNKNCGYKFKIFISEEDAGQFLARQPSIEPRYVFPVDSSWVVAYNYEEVKPLSIKRLSDLIKEETLRVLLRGFVLILKSPLTLIEPNIEPHPARKPLHRIEPLGPPDHHNKFCKYVKSFPEGVRECNRRIYENAKSFIGDQMREHDFHYCWLGLRKIFVPIVVNNTVYAVLVCGDWQRQASNIDKEELNKGKQRGKQTFDINDDLFDEVVFYSDNELDNKLKEIRNIRHQLESLAVVSYRAKRDEIDRRFLREVEAICTSSPLTVQKELWDRLDRILKRLCEFASFEAGILVLSEEEISNMLMIRSQYPPNFVSDKAALHSSDEIIKLLDSRKNIFSPDTVSIVTPFIKNNNQKLSIDLLGLCPINLQQRKGFLLLINRRVEHQRHISEYVESLLDQFIGNLIPHIRNYLSIIKLHKAEKDREELITLTLHTLNQYMDGIKANSVYLERLVNKSPLPLEEFLLTSQEIDELASGLESKTKALYYSTVINAGKEIEFRFDKSFSLMNVIEKARDKLIFFARKRKIEVILEIFSKDVPDIFGDEEKIELIFINMIHNAIKYSHNGKTVIITIRFFPDENKFRISVSNFGLGIPADVKDKIFLGYVRSHIKDARRPIPGTGLGLMITKRFLEGHGGSIELTSRKERKEFNSWELNKPEDWEGFNTIFTATLYVRPSNKSIDTRISEK